jgi:DNA ligase-1
MKDLISIVKSLRETSSRNDKESILTKAFNDGKFDLFKLLQLCYNPFATFGISTRTIEICEESKVLGPIFDVSFDMFESLLLKLKNRELTGNAAIDAIGELYICMDKELWEFVCKPVLLKDMRAGFTDNTVNKVLKALSKKNKKANDYIIPSFDVQLAFDGADEIITGSKMVQIKLDGVRILTICDKEANTVVQYTRNGKENVNFPHIRKVFEDLLPTLDKSMVFDGEVMSSSFQNLMSQVSKKDKVANTDTYLALFDCLTLEDFKNEKSNVSQIKRIELLDKLIVDSANVYKVPYSIVNLDTEQGKLDFNTFNKNAIDSGYEGVMVKKADAPYECKRTKSWLKIKPFITVTLPIADCEEGSGKNTGALGAFVAKGFDNSFEGKEIKVNVGSGFTDEQRKEFWENRKNMIGMLIEIKSDCLTLEEDSELYSLRFPRFLGFRSDSNGEKI